MMRKTIICTVLASVAVTLAAQPVAADAAGTGSWRVNVTSTVAGGSYSSVSSSDARNAWIVGTRFGAKDQPIVKRFDGARWHAVPAPAFAERATDVELTRVATLAPNNTWAIGGGTVSDDGAAVIAHWFNGRWYTRVLPAGSVIMHLSVLSATNVWFLGQLRTSAGVRPTSWHWNGTRWTSATLPATVEFGSDNPYYAAAQTSTGTHSPLLLRYSAGRWVVDRGPRVTLRPGARGYFFTGVVRRSASDVTVSVAYEASLGLSLGIDLYHWNGRTWTHLYGSATGSARTLCGDGQGGVWLLDAGTRTARLIDVRNGRAVVSATVPRVNGKQLQVEDISLRPGTRVVWAVGELVSGTSQTAAVVDYRP